MTRLIIIRGYPGSGKTTIGKILQADGFGTFIDHNAILTFIAGIAGDDEGIYDEIAHLELAMCKKLLKAGKDVIVARGFSSLSSIALYEQAASELGTEMKIVRLNVNDTELIRRVQSPERTLDFNLTVDETHALNWMRNNLIVNHQSEIIIDNNKPLNDVIDDMQAVL